jgi:hypothetical protein
VRGVIGLVLKCDYKELIGTDVSSGCVGISALMARVGDVVKWL